MKLILLLSLVIVASSSTASDWIGSAFTNSIGFIKGGVGTTIFAAVGGFLGSNL